ncbi:unnamed protein product [Effrenium voratum]|nr:unnamed protein product [Effrenium voratum]
MVRRSRSTACLLVLACLLWNVGELTFATPAAHWTSTESTADSTALTRSSSRTFAVGQLPRDNSPVTTSAAAASATFFTKVFAAGAQGATAAFVAAILSAMAEPLVNRLLVKRMTVGQAMKEMNFKLIANFFLTTFPTNMLKFPVFEIINMAMTFTAFSPGLSGTISGFLFCTVMLPVTNYRFRKSMGWEIKPALLYQAYVPTVARDIIYGFARGWVAVVVAGFCAPTSFVGQSAVFAFTIWAACILSSPCNEWRGFTLQPKDKKLSFGEYFKPVNYARSTGIGATIMGIALFVGRLVTPYAETACAYFKVHPLVGVGILAVLAGGLKVITSGEEEKEETKEEQKEVRRSRSTVACLLILACLLWNVGELTFATPAAHWTATESTADSTALTRSSRTFALGQLPRDNSPVTASAAAASATFFTKVFAAGAQGATAAFVAAILSAMAEPLVNRLLVKRMTVGQAMKEMNFKLIANFFLTTFPTNMLKFPVFEIINMAMTFTAFSPGLSGTISGFLFCTVMLPVTNYRFRKSMGWEIKPALLYQAYVPTVARDIIYGFARGWVAVVVAGFCAPTSFVGQSAVFAFTIWAACILSSPCNEWRGFTLQPKDKKLSFGEYFKPVNYARSTGIGATIMGIALFVGRLVTPYAETAFAYFKVHPLVGVGILAVLAGGLKVITSGEEEKEETKAEQKEEQK